MLAVNLLKTDEFQEALYLLKKSKELIELIQQDRNDKGLSTCHNNLAIYYKKRGQLKNALIHLEKSIEIESKFDVFTPDNKEMHKREQEYRKTISGLSR